MIEMFDTCKTDQDILDTYKIYKDWCLDNDAALRAAKLEVLINKKKVFYYSPIDNCYCISFIPDNKKASNTINSVNKDIFVYLNPNKKNIWNYWKDYNKLSSLINDLLTNMVKLDIND